MSSGAQTRQHGQFEATVVFNRPVCMDHYRLRLAIRHFPPSLPGQFVDIRCGQPVEREGHRLVEWTPGVGPQLSQAELAGRRPLLRRPFSIAGRIDRPGGVTELDVIHRVVGVGTAVLAEIEPGATLNLLGPLGQGFALAGDRPLAAVLGGGVGIPPMLYLAAALKAAGKDVTAFAGARSGALLPLATDPAEPPSQSGWATLCTGEFAELGVPTAVTTDDGTLGFPGFVHQAFLGWLDQRRIAPADLAVYACGPAPMLKAMGEVCLGRGIDCQMAMERHMGCGMGVCQSCIVKVSAGPEPGWRYALVCKEGPVFNAREVLW